MANAQYSQIQELIRLVPELRGKSALVSPLDGGLTNRNYRIDIGPESYVLRIAGKDTALLGIDRACEMACSEAAAGLGIGPAVVAYLPGHQALVRRFVSGRVLTPEDIRQPAMLARVARTLRRCHNGGLAAAGIFSPFATVRHYWELGRQRHASFPDNFGRALARLAELEEALRSGDPPCPCHNDLLAGNFIDDGAAVRVIDWEYGGMGDRFFDLGNLSANNELDPPLERDLLAEYFGEVRSDHMRRLRLMRLVSDLREASWGFLQAALSTLDMDYLAYGQKHLERFIKADGAAD
jgi:thiamine kinase-like enzyme